MKDLAVEKLNNSFLLWKSFILYLLRLFKFLECKRRGCQAYLLNNTLYDTLFILLLYLFRFYILTKKKYAKTIIPNIIL